MMCKQQRQPDNRNDNSHKSRSDSRAAKIAQCKPSYRAKSDTEEDNYNLPIQIRHSAGHVRPRKVLQELLRLVHMSSVQ